MFSIISLHQWFPVLFCSEKNLQYIFEKKNIIIYVLGRLPSAKAAWNSCLLQHAAAQLKRGREESEENGEITAGGVYCMIDTVFLCVAVSSCECEMPCCLRL